MKRQLIYHTHVDTTQYANKPIVVEAHVQTPQKTAKTSCFLNRISRDCITLSCNQDNLNQLMPKHISAPGQAMMLTLNFILHKEVEAECRVLYVRRLSKKEFVLELKFQQLSEASMQIIDEFVEKSLLGESLITGTSAKSEVADSAQRIKTRIQPFSKAGKQGLQKVA